MVGPSGPSIIIMPEIGRVWYTVRPFRESAELEKRFLNVCEIPNVLAGFFCMVPGAFGDSMKKFVPSSRRISADG
jgi:hypothetical protein